MVVLIYLEGGFLGRGEYFIFLCYGVGNLGVVFKFYWKVRGWVLCYIVKMLEVVKDVIFSFGIWKLFFCKYICEIFGYFLVNFECYYMLSYFNFGVL